MCYIWNKNILKKEISKYSGIVKEELLKRIQILDKIIFYDSKFEVIFNDLYDNFNSEKIKYSDNSRITVSAVVIVKNEERCILRCINSILNEFDQIVIVDTGSTDHTINLINNLKCEKIKIYYKEWSDDFSEIRNYALNKVMTDWVFFIDADEYLEMDNLRIKDYFSVLNELPYIENTIFCPKIVDVNKNIGIGVQRIFKTGIGIEYYGKVHEELRKYENGKKQELFKISIDIQINHDGYQEQIMKEKDKTNRNFNLLKMMIRKEPNNPRWMYFYLRDGNDIISLDEYEKCVKQYLLIDRNKPFKFENLYQHEYSYAILTLYAIKNFMCGELEKTQNISKLMNQIKPENSDSVYLNTYSQILLLRSKEYQLLKEIIEYRKHHMDSQYGMIHSEGMHIDMLIGYLLFQTSHIKKAMEYFEITNKISNQDMIIQQCIKTIEQIKNSCMF